MAHEPFGWNCDVGDVERASVPKQQACACWQWTRRQYSTKTTIWWFTGNLHQFTTYLWGFTSNFMILKAVADSFPVKNMSSSNPWGSPAWRLFNPFQVSGRMARCMARVSTSTVMAWIHCCPLGPLGLGPGGCEDWLSDSYTMLHRYQMIPIYPYLSKKSYPIPPTCLHQHWVTESLVARYKIPRWVQRKPPGGLWRLDGASRDVLACWFWKWPMTWPKSVRVLSSDLIQLDFLTVFTCNDLPICRYNSDALWCIMIYELMLIYII